MLTISTAIVFDALLSGKVMARYISGLLLAKSWFRLNYRIIQQVKSRTVLLMNKCPDAATEIANDTATVICGGHFSLECKHPLILAVTLA